VKNISVCGSICDECAYYGNLCVGCEAAQGKVFHAKDNGCAIFNCARTEKGYKNCLEFSEIPCDIWHSTRDPQFSDEEFAKNINERIAVLKNYMK
jgi:hypothetical protein